MVVLDTNVVVAAMKSSSGASHEILRLVDTGEIDIGITVPLVAEYEDVTSRSDLGIPISQKQIDAILDRLCAVGHESKVYFLWRPILPDPKDDLVLEAALASQAATIITFNVRDFRPTVELGIEAVTPAEYLTRRT